MGSCPLWLVSSYEDLSHYICPAYCSDLAGATDQSRGGQKDIEVEEVHQIYWEFPKPRAVSLHWCGWRSFLHTHRTLLSHVSMCLTVQKVFIIFSFPQYFNPQ